MRKIGAIKKVGSVSGSDGVARMNAYRLRLGAREWGEAQRKRLDRLAPRVPLGPPLEPMKELLRLPLYVTRLEGSQRDWKDVEALIRRVNDILEPALIAFELTEPCEGQRPLKTGLECSFGADLDHQYELLHLVFVAHLPPGVLALPGCGRCCLLPDSADAREAARSLAMLLGLAPRTEVSATDALLGTGTGLLLSGDERLWLYSQGAAMAGQEEASEPVVVPVWAYQAETPPALATSRSESDVQELLERINRIYRQAGVAFELSNWCHLQEDEFSAADWDRALSGQPEGLTQLTRFGPHALHIFFLNDEREPAPAKGIAILSDRIQKGKTRHLARLLGKLLGLSDLPGEDQLMAPGGDGFRLSSQEIRICQGQARERARLAPVVTLPKRVEAPPVELAEPPAQLVQPARIHLLRGLPQAAQMTREQASDWLAEANAVWAQAGIRLDVLEILETRVEESTIESAFPSASDNSGRVAKSSGLQRLPGYSPDILNIVVVGTLPLVGMQRRVGAYNFWRQANLLLVPETYPRHTPTRHLALSLAQFWGLKWTTDGPFYRLTTWQATGLRLSPTEVETARRSVMLARQGALPEVISSEDEIVLPLRVHRVEGASTLSQQQADEVSEQLNRIWAPAGIRFDCRHNGSTPVKDLARVCPNDPGSNTSRVPDFQVLQAAPDYRADCLNLFWVEKVLSAVEKRPMQFQASRAHRALLLPEEFHDFPLARTAARAFAYVLGLPFSNDVSQERLTFNGPGGMALEPSEIERAREAASRLLQALEDEAEPLGDRGDLDELLVPVRLHAVRNEAHGTTLSLAQMRPLMEQVQATWKQAGIRLQFSYHQTPMENEALLPALPNERGRTDRERSFEGILGAHGYEPEALNVFVLRQVVSVGETVGKEKFSQAPSYQQRCLLVAESHEEWTLPKCLGYALGGFFGLAPDEYLSAGNLMSRGGERLGARDVQRARTRVQELFPRESDAPWLAGEAQLRVPVRIVAIGVEPEVAKQALLTASQTWTRQAKVGFDLVEISSQEVPPEALYAALPNARGAVTERKPTTAELQKLPGYSSEIWNVFFLERLTFAEGEGEISTFNSSGTRVTLVSLRGAPGRNLAMAFGQICKLAFVPGPPTRLMMAHARGTRLVSEEIEAARGKVIELFSQGPIVTVESVSVSEVVPTDEARREAEMEARAAELRDAALDAAAPAPRIRVHDPIAEARREAEEEAREAEQREAALDAMASTRAAQEAAALAAREAAREAEEAAFRQAVHAAALEAEAEAAAAREIALAVQAAAEREAARMQEVAAREAESRAEGGLTASEAPDAQAAEDPAASEEGATAEAVFAAQRAAAREAALAREQMSEGPMSLAPEARDAEVAARQADLAAEDDAPAEAQLAAQQAAVQTADAPAEEGALAGESAAAQEIAARDATLTTDAAPAHEAEVAAARDAALTADGAPAQEATLAAESAATREAVLAEQAAAAQEAAFAAETAAARAAALPEEAVAREVALAADCASASEAAQAAESAAAQEAALAAEAAAAQEAARAAEEEAARLAAEAAAVPPPQTVRLRIRVARNASNGCPLPGEQVQALIGHVAQFWQSRNVALELLGLDELEVGDDAIQETFPNAPGQLMMRAAMCFGMMRLPGHDPRIQTLIMVGRIPQVGSDATVPLVPYPASKITVVASGDPQINPAECLAQAIAQLLG